MSRLSSDIIINSFSTPFNLKEFVEHGLNYKYLKFTSVLTWYLQAFLPLIFYAQFGYLYSFTPSIFTKETISNLVKKSMERNKLEVAKVYSTLKDGYVTYFTAKTMSLMNFNKATNEVEKVADAYELRSAAAAAGGGKIDNS
jgi:hypothetical protein